MVAQAEKNTNCPKKPNKMPIRMKTMLLIASLILANLLNGAAQTKPTKEAEQVQRAITGVFDGFAGLDFGKVMRHCTPDLIILEDGVVWNADSVSAALNRRKDPGFKRVNAFDFLQTEIQGDVAWTSYYNTADFEIDGRSRKVKWLESAVLVKQRNEWKVKLLHSTVIRPKQK
jgi:ketosteroid isomerase-like protein